MTDSIFDRVSCRDILTARGIAVPTKRGAHFKCPLPGHDEATASFHLVGADERGFKCFGACGRGGGVADLPVALGVARDRREAAVWLEEHFRPGAAVTNGRRNEGHEEKSSPPPLGRLAATYDYRDANGKLLRQVRRFEWTDDDGEPAKRFSQRRPLPDGGWGYKLAGVPDVPYKLPELRRRCIDGRERLVVAEGEKDVATIEKRLGYAATTNAGGADWKWTPQFVECFRGVPSIVVIGDNDDGGRKAAREHAALLAAIVDDVGLIESIPGIKAKGDVTDWANEGHGPDDFEQLLAIAERIEPAASTMAADEGAGAAIETPAADDTRPVINTSGRDFSSLIAFAIDSLDKANSPPRIFRYAETVARVKPRGDGIHVYSVATMRTEMARVAHWCRSVGDTTLIVPTEPKRSVIESVLEDPESPFPLLRGIVKTPYFTADGTLVTAPGYDSRSRLYLALDPDFIVPTVPSSAKSVARAVDFIKDLIGDFPFATDADLAHAFALMIVPFVREAVPGPCPLTLIEAPVAGTGKSKLCKVLLGPACGDVPVRTLGRDDDESRKAITSILLSGVPAVLLDNLSGKLQSASLASVLTSTKWSDRRLGTNTHVEVENRTIWAASANNLAMTTELARRTVSIRLDAGIERPEYRTNFRHELPEYGIANRGRLCAAVLTIISAWVAAGQPKSAATLGSYERWAEVVGGILGVAGIRGFLGDRDRLMETADAEAAEWRAFVSAWLESFGTAEVTAAQLLPLATAAGIDVRTDDAKSGAMRLGRKLGAMRDRVFDEHQIVAKTKKTGWRLRPRPTRS